jgi:hypothetical protein
MSKNYIIHFILVALLIHCTTSAISNNTKYINASLLHNSYFSKPSLPESISCPDCSGFRSFPQFGYTIGFYVNHFLNKKIDIVFGARYSKYSFLTKQSEEVARTYLPTFKNPTVSLYQRYDFIQLPILLNLNFRKLSFSFGFNNSVAVIQNTRSYTFNNQLNGINKNLFKFNYNLMENKITKTKCTIFEKRNVQFSNLVKIKKNAANLS